MSNPLAPLSQLNDGDPAGRDPQADAICTTSARNIQPLVGRPFSGLVNPPPAQTYRCFYHGASINLGQSLLWFEDAAIIDQGDDPAALCAVDQVLHFAVDVHWRCFRAEMREEMRRRGHQTFVQAEQVGHGAEDNAATPDPVHRHQRIAGRGFDLALRAGLKRDALIAKSLTA